MPAQPEHKLDVRHWELAEKLRAAPPAPSGELRERVLALAAEPLPARRRMPSWRLALVLAPTVLVVALVGVVGGPNGGDDSSETAAQADSRAPSGEAFAPRSRVEEAPKTAAPSTAAQDLGGTALTTLPPARRLQEYRAELRVHVRGLEALGDATRRAMRITRTLGGYVVVADYGVPNSEHGESLLVVRVPVGRVQDAIFRFSDLGSTLAQQVRIQDLQAGFDRTERRIRSLRRTIADLQRQAAASDLTPEERARLRLRLLNARQDLTAQLRVREATLRRGRLARVSLTLTTRSEAAPAPSRPAYFERTLRDALSVVGKAVAWTLYVLIVAAPFLALGLLVLLGERLRRRRADERLLQRAPAA